MKHLSPLFLAAALALAGCPSQPLTTAPAGTTAQADKATAERTLFAVKGAYTVALSAATAYRRLPVCPQSAPLCHTADTLHQLQAADDVAARAIKAAEDAAAAPNLTAAAVTLALQAASTAVDAFRAITPTGAKP